MVILGASHQLVPVLIEGKLYSNKLAYTSFVLAAIGIPLLCYGFYEFNMGAPAKWGGRFVVLALLAYLINIGISISKVKTKMYTLYLYLLPFCGYLLLWPWAWRLCTILRLLLCGIIRYIIFHYMYISELLDGSCFW